MESIYQKEWQKITRAQELISEMLKSQILNQKTLSVFLPMLSVVIFHLEIVSANMTFTNQSMNIHVKDIYKALQCYKCHNMS